MTKNKPDIRNRDPRAIRVLSKQRQRLAGLFYVADFPDVEKLYEEIERIGIDLDAPIHKNGRV